MELYNLLVQIRRAAGMSQEELAQRVGTSRPTLSAYEHGRKSPTLATVGRLCEQAGFELVAQPSIVFHQQYLPRGRPIWVPNRLPRLEMKDAFAKVVLPIHLNWSPPDKEYDLRSRHDRARVYAIVLREGRPQDIQSYVDGLLLADLWDELVLPQSLRRAWEPVVLSALELKES